MKTAIVLIFVSCYLFIVQSTDEVKDMEIVKIPAPTLRSLKKFISMKTKSTDDRPTGWILLFKGNSKHKIRKHHGRMRPCPNGMKIDHMGNCRKPWN
uniref:Uncharacterized protein n=1 Tax=Rhodnius prolixus TaxID=13249 RepID=A0A4P6D7K1_RHOPR